MYVQGFLFFFFFLNFYILRGRDGGEGERGGGLEQFGCCGAGWEGKGGLGVFFRQGKGCGANVADRLMDDDNK